MLQFREQKVQRKAGGIISGKKAVHPQFILWENVDAPRIEIRVLILYRVTLILFTV